MVSAENIGKKTVCKKCGELFRIRVGEAAPVRSDSAKSASGRGIVPDSPAPSDLDVYGLDEQPAEARTTNGSPVEDSSASSGGDGAVPPPPRMKAYKPMTEAQKKKIAKRAAKIEKTKVSNATVGVSFGAVLAIALFGWRIYRVVHRIERAANRANAAQSAPGDIDSFDPKTIADAMDKDVAERIVQPTTSEAREWLDPKYPNHAVAEMPIQTAREMVAGFYERGAEKVFVLDPADLNGTFLTAEIAVRLPKEPALRKKCLEWAAKHEGDAPGPDLGQKFLLITTD
jgi:hypothetical protein